MTSKLALIYKALDEESKTVLWHIEAALKKYEYVPVGYIARKTRLPPKRLEAVLSFLNSKKLIRRRIGHEVGYTLTFLGLDMLALDSLVKRGVIEALGNKIGVGKESDIYEALSPSGERIALKLHRIGRTSFRKTLRTRPYIFERQTTSWLEESKLSAQREFTALKELTKYTKYVPSPHAYNRHAVVTSFIEGIELYRVRKLTNPQEALEKIIEVIKIAYNKVGIIHGDLSEYNIIISYPTEDPLIIDWPQYFYKEHPQAQDILRRDIHYVVRYFNKRFNLKVNSDEVFRKVVTG